MHNFPIVSVAIFLELFAALVLLSSNRTFVWLRKHNRTKISRAITSLPQFRYPMRLSTMGQYSLLSYFLKEKPKTMSYLKILNILNIEKLEKLQYRVKAEEIIGDGNKALLILQSNSMIDIEKSILLWHIATELCYYLDHD